MIRTFEDCLNNGAGYEEAEHARRAWREQQAEIEAIRATIADVPRSRRRYTRPVAPQPKPVPKPVPERAAINMDHHWPPERVKQLRDALKMSQRELADVLRVQKNTVSRWELGERTPRHGTVKDELLALEQRVNARKVSA